MPATNDTITLPDVVGLAAVAAVGYGSFRIIRAIFSSLKPPVQRFTIPLEIQSLQIVTTHNEFCDGLQELRTHCDEFPVLGLSCDWTRDTVQTRNPIKSLQLSSYRGTCLLIKFCHLDRIPTELKQLLSDGSILKVGANILRDVKVLNDDCNIEVAGVVDLHHLASKTLCAPYAVYNAICSIEKYYIPDDSDWEFNRLSLEENAARNTHESVIIFEQLAGYLVGQRGLSMSYKEWFDDCIENEVRRIIDQPLPLFMVSYEVNPGPKFTIPLYGSLKSMFPSYTASYLCLEHMYEKIPLLGLAVLSNDDQFYLHLSSYRGKVAVISLWQMNHNIQVLRQLLSNEQIYKVGINIMRDIQILEIIFNLQVFGAIDLRHLAHKSGISGSYEFLGLTETILGGELDRTRLNRARTSLVIFVNLAERLVPRCSFMTYQRWFCDYVRDKIKIFKDRPYVVPSAPPPQRPVPRNEQTAAVAVAESTNAPQSAPPEPKILVATTPIHVFQGLKILRKHCVEFPVLGLDCESIELLQLSSFQGARLLVRFNRLKKIPKALENLLSNNDILKVGIDILNDVRTLETDYNIKVSNVLDLRHLAHKANISVTDGLAGLARTILQIDLDESQRVNASNWSRKKLSLEQIAYAANTVYFSVLLFERFAKLLVPQTAAVSHKKWFESVHNKITCFKDQPYLILPGSTV
ncbi:uncharacterized protein LOC128742199 [Sabethes cyaneus]|uniref:uncharacterized protein LOC128742199 n=1 Tax=Sabethes cyaneus TaxID=53552 RepID=UPI00237D5041|nr:uncharacterized protein LOC128742199 [Sabethes cyaneus]XP_053694448.1 uncharacterized protein LOC128742199 [Sabethes cyaneus]